jgi:hypothetical protein
MVTGSAWMPCDRPMRTVILVFHRAGLQRLQHPVHPRQQQVGGAHQLDVERGVEHVRGRHPLMDEARLVIADNLGQMRKEGDDVMLGHAPRSRRCGPRRIPRPSPPHRLRVSFGMTPRSACASQAWASISYQMRNLVAAATISGRE